MTAVFSPPTYNVQFEAPLDYWHTAVGKSVYRYLGLWYETVNPYWGADATSTNAAIIGVRDADIVATASRPGGERTDGTDRDRYLFLGGRVYVVSDTIATELTAAGYASRLNIEAAPVLAGNGYTQVPLVAPALTPTQDGSWV